MTRSTLLAVVFALAPGCVVYDYPCNQKDRLFDGDGDDDGGDDGDLLDDGGGDDGGDLLDDTEDTGDFGDTGDTGEEEVVAPEAFSLTPGEVDLAESTLADLLAVDVEDFDHTLISGVSFTGDVVLCALELQPEGATVSFAAPFDAALGPVHMVVELGELGVVTVEDAVTVTDPGGLVVPDPEADPCG